MQQYQNKYYLRVDVEGKSFGRDGVSVPVLKDISFAVSEGAFFAILGPSGCGKTTLLRLIAGLDEEYDGSIKVERSSGVSSSSRAGIVFQESRLLPWKTVAQNVQFALSDGISRQEKLEKVSEALSLVNLQDFKEYWPSMISGGMQRRVALARALVGRCDILLLDEPFSGLDTFTKYKLQSYVRELGRAQKLTILLVTHDLDEAAYMSDVIAIMGEKPSTISEIVDVPLPEKRDRADPSFAAFRSSLYELAMRHLDKDEQ